MSETYGKQRKHALRIECRDRSIPYMYSATKRTMIAALLRSDANKETEAASSQTDASDDEQQAPFRFRDLPPELRNKIYALVAENPVVTRNGAAVPRFSLCYTDDLHLWQRQNRVTIQQPDLFRISKQVRAESLSLFYVYHHFHFNMKQPHACSKMIMGWLDRLAPADRAAIRQLMMTFGASFKNPEPWMKQLHAKLSDTATVEYCGIGHSAWNFVRKVGKSLMEKNPDRMPVFKVGQSRYGLAEMDIIGDGSLWRTPLSLAIEPGKSWFGHTAVAEF